MAKLGGILRKWREKLRRVKVKNWMLVLILIPLLFVDATLMRNDHIRMTELRDAVLAADAQIKEEMSAEEFATAEQGLKDAIVKLKEFVFSNVVINIVEDNGAQKITFGTGPFYLEHEYLRAAQAALAAAEQKLTSDNNPNGNIYGEAGAICKAQALANGWTWDNVNFINCMMSEINKYPSASEIQDTIVANLPSTELYRLNYASPVWAPTLTGFMLLATGVIVLVILVRMVIWVVLRLSLLFV